MEGGFPHPPDTPSPILARGVRTPPPILASGASQRTNRFAEDVAGSSNRDAFVRRAEKAGLVSARREIDAAVETAVEKSGEDLGVARQRRRIVAHGSGREKNTEHRAALGELDGDALGAARADHGISQLVPQGVEPGVGIGLFEQPESCDAGGHGQRIPAQGAGLINRTERSEQIHDIGATAESADGQPAADNFPEAGQVGGEGTLRVEGVESQERRDR